MMEGIRNRRGERKDGETEPLVAGPQGGDANAPPPPPPLGANQGRRGSTHNDSVVNRKEAERIEKMIAGMSDRAPPQLASFLKAIAPIIGIFIQICIQLAPIIIAGSKAGFAIYRKLPKNVITIIYGFAICFFGGHFAVCFAAIEAFKATGGDTFILCVKDFYEDMKKVKAQSDFDDTKDDNNDGIADVDQITSKELVQRKIGLALRTIDPDRFTASITGMYQGYMAVIMVLKFQFARTITLAVSIGNQLRPMASTVLAPSLSVIIPKEYHQWIAPVINYLCKAVAMSIAWYIQRIISMVQCALQGGLMVARAALRILNEKGFVKLNDTDTFIDEIVGYGLAGLGCWFQISSGWDLPFYVDFILMPFHLLEWFLKWSVTWMDARPAM